MIELKGITAGYRHRILMEDVSLTFRPGRLVALLGRNGTGKSTLLRAMAGIGPVLNGQVLLDGRDITGMARKALSRAVAWVGTSKVRVPDLTCRALVALGRSPYTDWIGRLSPEDEAAVDQALEAVGMSSYAERTMDKMSDGECQRIMVARALAQDTPNLLLDEPTAFLDLPGRYAAVRLLHDLAERDGKTIVFSTHDLDVALQGADDILLIRPEGVSFGAAEEFSRERTVEKAFGLEMRERKEGGAS